MFRRGASGRKSVSGPNRSGAMAPEPQPPRRSVGVPSGSRRPRIEEEDDEITVSDHLPVTPGGVGIEHPTPTTQPTPSTHPTAESGAARRARQGDAPVPAAEDVAPEADEDDATKQEELRAAVFKYWFTKGPVQQDESCRAQCNFCSQSYKHPKGGGYGNLRRHIKNKHPDKYGMSSNQTQLTGYATSSSQPPGLFSYD